eukprot:CAMPEP_0194283484 /NCGR_PEP_ID=MMETSP0169-20130528/25482_1 /TAXON_ID=218684 /ORGANISM="Corethron pennatum, Strain L29A3" /LENGTH=451 /DNA_ID=CAMNT_0039029099 /DNA_START=450 /DNA_END=1805 /DNA_ORIENTATION=+
MTPHEHQSFSSSGDERFDTNTSRVTYKLERSSLTEPLEILEEQTLERMDNSQMCSGVLISPSVVLTAAHCALAFGMPDNLEGGDPPRGRTIAKWGFNIVIGMYRRDRLTDGEVAAVHSVTVHPLYVNTELSHDLALVYLEAPVETTPVCLPPSAETLLVPDVSILTVMGWGASAFFENAEEDDGYGPTNVGLLVADATYISNEKCDEEHLDWIDITADMLCVSVADGSDACRGDSGGPLVMLGEEGSATDVLHGVVSWGVGCGLYPGVYARVGEALEWIEEGIAVVGETARNCPSVATELEPPVAILSEPPSEHPSKNIKDLPPSEHPSEHSSEHPSEYPSKNIKDLPPTKVQGENDRTVDDSRSAFPSVTPSEHIKPIRGWGAAKTVPRTKKENNVKTSKSPIQQQKQQKGHERQPKSKKGKMNTSRIKLIMTTPPPKDATKRPKQPPRQ